MKINLIEYVDVYRCVNPNHSLTTLEFNLN